LASSGEISQRQQLDRAEWGELLDQVTPMDWDIEAQENAYAEIQRLQQRDPEAASLLMAQLLVTQEAQRKERMEHGDTLHALSDPDVYRPSTLYAYVALKTGWGHMEMVTMHYFTFFTYVREFLERDKREHNSLHAQQMGMYEQQAYPGQRTVDFND
jgi:hypothetical protein